MDTLIIVQDPTKEEKIKSFDFHRLYEILKHNENDLLTLNVVGWINVPNAYIEEYLYVRNTCPNLTINDNFESYITIEDPVARTAIANLWGDKVGMTQKRAEMYQGTEVTKASFDPYREGVTDLSVFSYMKNINTIPYQLFLDCVNLETISLSSSLRTLKEQAFFGCKKLSSFGDLSNLTRIENHALQDTLLDNISCNNLVYLGSQAFRNTPLISAHIDGPLITTDWGWFYDCKQLQTVTGLSQLTFIPSNCFQYCHALTSVENMENKTSIRNNAFTDCYSITELNTDNLITIGSEAFTGCTGLTYINTSNVTTIANYTFQRTTSLQSLDLSNVTSLGQSVFYRSGIKNISLPSLETGIGSLGSMIRESQVETVTFNEESTGWTTPYIIPSYFAYGATNLKTINLGNCKQINSDAFGGCSSLISIGEQPETPILTKLNGGSIFWGCTNLDHVDISLVNEIPGATFYRCKHLKSIGNNNVLPNVEYIRGDAFREMGTSGEEGLGEISFPNCRLTESQCFKDSYGITKINFGENYTEIKVDSFCRCYDLEYITGLDNVTICRNDVFWECPKLKEISLPKVEQFIDGGAQFYRCKGLTSVNLPKLTTFGGNSTFYECRIDGLLNLPLLEDTWGQETFSRAQIKKINLHNCKKLYQYQFENNSLLEEIDLSSCEEFTGRNVFLNCSSLKTIELPSFSGDVPYMCFRYCNALTSITFGNNNIRLTNECITYCENLKTINLNKCTYIGDGALCENPKLESIGTLSNELTYIGREAFRNDTMLSGNITIPASVETIGYRAFWNCGSITSITMLATTPPQMNYESFNGSLAYPIYVPAGSVNAYKNATNWINIASRIYAAS